MSKDPEERFSSVTEFADALRDAGAEVSRPEPSQTRVGDQFSTIVDELLPCVDAILAAPGLNSSLRAPTCSINYGIAGLAFTLYRIAGRRTDPRLLAYADACSRKATSAIASDQAFSNAEIGITPDVVGEVSPYHAESGVYAVQALISHAMGDFSSQSEAVRSFAAASSRACDNLDLTLGRSSTLLACSLLLDAAPNSELVDRAPLMQLAAATMAEIWEKLDAMETIPACTELPILGMAHGWAGFLYATLRWCRSSGAALPEGLPRRLAELASCGEGTGRGLRWSRKIITSDRRRAHDYMPGWCNGSAGFVHLWTLPNEFFGDDEFAELAERAAWNCWDDQEAFPNLCCGTAGRAYAMLNLYRHSAESKWLHRARRLAQTSAAGAEHLADHKQSPQYSLY